MTLQLPLRLHGHPISSNTRRVQLVLAHLELRYELLPVNLMSPEARAALRALNPNEKIPVLQHGDFVLWESHAIMQYVSELRPGQALYPCGALSRADINRWLFWHNAHLAPPLGGLGFERMWKKKITGEEADAGQIARHESAVAVAAKVLDGHLATRTWLAGDALSLADLSVAATLANAQMYGAHLEPYRHVRALWDRVRALPAWAATEPAAVPPLASASEARSDCANVS